MRKLPLKDRVFWTNFFQCLVMFIGFAILFGFAGAEEGFESFSFLEGYLIASFFAVLILCNKIAREFSRGVEIDEFMAENNLDRKELREKYGKLFDI